jgi:hypothetical protein
MKAILLSALFFLSTQAQNITCPILECQDTPLENNKCFEHDGSAPTSLFKGGLCFDIKKAPITALPYYCPFDLEQKQYAWVEEYLQAQDSRDLNMKCKYSQQSDPNRQSVIVAGATEEASVL